MVSGVPPDIRKDALALLRTFKDPGEATFKRAQETIDTVVTSENTSAISLREQLLFILSRALSERTLAGYATLDYAHIRDIRDILGHIRRYSEDASQARPLNFLMLAAPGAGKSHFIKCIAKSLGTDNIGAVTYNMVGLERHEDLIPALDAARNLKVEDRLPLLFLDEFDVKPANYPLLLPLLWDGQITLGRQELKLGKVVIVLAGSDPQLPTVIDYARSLRPSRPEADSAPKLIDLLSRINGKIIELPQLSDPARATHRYADKVCIAVNLLRQRLGNKLSHVSVAFLRFIARTEFRYGVRSMAHLIDLLPPSKAATELPISSIRLPFGDAGELKASSLAYHLTHDDQAHGVVKLWHELAANKTSLVVNSDAFEFLTSRIGDLASPFFSDFVLNRIWRDLQAPKSAPRRRRSRTKAKTSGRKPRAADA